MSFRGRAVDTLQRFVQIRTRQPELQPLFHLCLFVPKLCGAHCKGLLLIARCLKEPGAQLKRTLDDLLVCEHVRNE